MINNEKDNYNRIAGGTGRMQYIECTTNDENNSKQ